MFPVFELPLLIVRCLKALKIDTFLPVCYGVFTPLSPSGGRLAQGQPRHANVAICHAVVHVEAVRFSTIIAAVDGDGGNDVGYDSVAFFS
ncbi:MAG: hypothetical protein GWQ08_10700 [Verrucomicrobiaceae bacterium]|nr:hypothetical protein [Verrucomicrobiaceae bacterium]